MFNTKKVQDAEAKAEAQKLLRVKAEGDVKVEKVKLKKSEELVRQLQDDNKVLTSRVEKQVTFKQKELELDEREKLLNSKQKNQSTYEAEIKKLQEQIKEAKDRGYKEGYADGVSDGVRKGMDLTKDDRKMMAQIAALAAASHSPEATNAIAREVANGIGRDLNELPATTGSSNN